MKAFLISVCVILMGYATYGLINYFTVVDPLPPRYPYLYGIMFLLGLGSLIRLVTNKQTEPEEVKEPTLCQKALSILESIPSDKFITSFLVSSFDRTVGCASGHFMGRIDGLDRPSCGSKEANRIDRELRDITSKYLDRDDILRAGYVSVNNRPTGIYTQSNPKDRVIALLKDCVKAGL